jgi:hypothetical protein
MEPIRGQECANSTNIPEKMKKLKKLGGILEEAQRGNFELTDVGFAKRPLKAAGRLCTLMDLVLRFLHVEEIGKKQWFFRPVKAYVLIEQMKKQKSQKKKK